MSKPTFFEFFAGAGMARAGLGDGWDCKFANDFDHKKGFTYQNNWGSPGVLKVGDIRGLSTNDLAEQVDLVWGSFPCQDLSLAGGGAGLRGERSGTFYPFWALMNGLRSERRGPKIIALENVCGTLTSHAGTDFAAICDTFRMSGYRYGGLVIDASLFVPQSRPRLFLIGVRADIEIDQSLVSPGPSSRFHTRSLQGAVSRISSEAREDWVWWNPPLPPLRSTSFADFIENNPASTVWHSEADTEKLLSIMSPTNLSKVEAAKRAGRRMVGCIYKRTRREERGKIVRAEVRFDEVAGCLRTPSGGSSRQVILVVEGTLVRSRLISARETADLMGLPKHYRLPRAYNEAYHLTGDGVVVQVVRHIAEHIFEPILGLGPYDEQTSRRHSM